MPDLAQFMIIGAAFVAGQFGLAVVVGRFLGRSSAARTAADAPVAPAAGRGLAASGLSSTPRSTTQLSGRQRSSDEAVAARSRIIDLSDTRTN